MAMQAPAEDDGPPEERIIFALEWLDQYPVTARRMGLVGLDTFAKMAADPDYTPGPHLMRRLWVVGYVDARGCFLPKVQEAVERWFNARYNGSMRGGGAESPLPRHATNRA